ncbi:MAG: hypothetical protein M3Y54_19165 [Bacteroidota bacterium]|nr:hypothetical protein [Bacteroidota bacterium]
MTEFLPFQTFPSAGAAEPLLALLRERSIPFEAAVDTGQPIFDPAMTFHSSYATYVVKLHGADFEWVRRLREEGSRDALATLSSDHYLFKFSDAELFELLAKPEEWSPLDVSLAGQLLRQRGRDVSADTVRLLREHRTVEQLRPEPTHSASIVWGYLLAALGGIVAFFIGWHLYSHKKTLADGRQVPAHSPADRVHGLRIMTLGVLSFMFWAAFRIWWRQAD